MHDAYDATAILKLTVQIESIAAYGKYITSFFCVLTIYTNKYTNKCLEITV